jgi:hypothetical protein
MTDAVLDGEVRMDDRAFFLWLVKDGANDGGGCVEAKNLGGGVYAAVKPLLFHWTMIVGLIGDRCSTFDRYCFLTRGLAEWGLRAWDGTGEPVGWHRHPATGRRRSGGDPAAEYIAW